MQDDQHDRANELFREVRNLAPQAQAARLDRECGGDNELRAQVESLLHPAVTTASMPTEVLEAQTRSGNDLPESIGPYRVIHEIGQGGMGVVYRGAREDSGFKLQVAIKVVKRGMDTNEILRRFELERQLLAAMNHVGIARLYDGGQTSEGLPYFAMEFVEGQPIDEYCDTHRLRIGERLELFRLVCAAVQYAHQNLVVHRDLKPSNIIVTKEGVPKLLDFGIAKLINPELSLLHLDPTAPLARVMTPDYASPEQVRGDPITTASDIYSLGVLLYELVTGHRPYRFRTRVRGEIERVICDVDPVKPSTAISKVGVFEQPAGPTPGSPAPITPESVSKVREGRPDRLRRRLAGDIDNIVLMALRKEPQRRYTSAEQFAEDLRRHLVGLPVIARGDKASYRARKFIRRHRTGVAATSVVAASLVFGITTSSWQAKVAATEREVAIEERDRAERMFSQVRELARKLMFDLHDEIKKSEGSLPARKMLVETALEYLDGVSTEVGHDPQLQREIAAAYDRVGDIRGGVRGESLGDMAGALENYRTGLALRLQLAAAAPMEDDLQKEVSTSHIHVGDMLLNTGQVNEALQEYEKALQIHETRSETDPLDVMKRRDRAIAMVTVGEVLLKVPGSAEQGVIYYERSLAIRQDLARRNTDNLTLQRDLSVGYNRFARIRSIQGDHLAAIESYMQAVAIRERLVAAEPESGRAKRDLAIAHYFIGLEYLTLDRPATAMDHLQPFLEACEERVRANPSSARTPRDLALAHEGVGRAHAMSGDWQRARESYEAFQAIIIALSQSNRDNTHYRSAAASSYERLAEAAAAAGDLTLAAERYRQAVILVEKLVAEEPDHVIWLADRARTLTGLGGVLTEAGQFREAELHLDGAVELYASLSRLEAGDVSVQRGYARALHRRSRLMAELGDADQALADAQRAVDTAERPKPEMLRDLAVALSLTGDNARAAETVEASLNLLAEQEQSEVPPDEGLRNQLRADLLAYRTIR